MGATILRSTLPDLYLDLLANLDQVIYGRYDIPLQMMDLFNVEKASGSFVNETSVSGLGTVPVKNESAPSAMDQIYQGFDKKFTPVVYSLMYSISKEAMSDQNFIQITKNTRELERSFRSTKEIILAGILNNGFTSTTTADGVYLFSASHKLTPSGTQSNLLAADLSVTSLQTALNQYADMTNLRGLLLGLQPGRLVVPMELSWLAKEILKSDLRSDTSANAMNAFKDNMIDISVKNYLTDADAWFLFPKDNKDHNMKLKVWQELKTYADIDFDTGDFKYKGDERYVPGVSDYLGLLGSSGA